MAEFDPIGKDLDTQYNSIVKAIGNDTTEPAIIINALLTDAYYDMTTVSDRLEVVRKYADSKGYKIKAEKEKKK